MAGHRRISTDLFLKYVDRTGTRSKVDALLELNFDDYKGSRRSVRAYARIWRWGRGKVDALIAEYETDLEALDNQKRGDSRPATDPPPSMPPSSRAIGHTEGHESAEIPRTSHGQSAGQSATESASHRPPTMPLVGHYLEQEQEPEPEPKEGERVLALELNGGPTKGKRRKPERACPAELEADEREGVRAFARELGKPCDGPALNFAWQRLLNWAESDDVRKRDWAAAFKTAIAKGWVFEGFGATDPTLSPAQARAARTKAAARSVAAKIVGSDLVAIEGGKIWR